MIVISISYFHNLIQTSHCSGIITIIHKWCFHTHKSTKQNNCTVVQWKNPHHHHPSLILRGKSPQYTITLCFMWIVFDLKHNPPHHTLMSSPFWWIGISICFGGFSGIAWKGSFKECKLFYRFINKNYIKNNIRITVHMTSFGNIDRMWWLFC